MSYDWTKEELSAEIIERVSEGESTEKTLDFIWSIVGEAYKERDTAIKELCLALESYVLMVAETASAHNYENATKHPLLERYRSYMESK